ncbi:MAG: hypothetical protein K6E40_15855 [Desulfovibrio sp.]|nr:hypothetical protein [Desulfovibrio sp.]
MSSYQSPIAAEVADFLSSTGIPQRRLAEASGVNPVYISRLKNGTQKDVRSAYADSLRDAMRRLRDDSEDAEGED